MIMIPVPSSPTTSWRSPTQRLRLRPMRRDDAEALFLVFCDAQAMRYLVVAAARLAAAHRRRDRARADRRSSPATASSGRSRAPATTPPSARSATGAGSARTRAPRSASSCAAICGGRASPPRRSPPSSTGASAASSCTASRRSSTPATSRHRRRWSASDSGAKGSCASRTSTATIIATRSYTACCAPNAKVPSRTRAPTC